MPQVLVIRGQGRRQRPRPAERLKPRWDVQEIHPRMIPAAGTDELKRVGVAAFHPAIYEADRLSPQEGGPAMPGLTGQREHQEDLSTDTQPRVAAFVRHRRGDRVRTDGRLGKGLGTAHFLLTASHLAHRRGGEFLSLPRFGQRGYFLTLR